MNSYLPIFELLRGTAVESIHYGAIAVVNARGQLIASFGDPQITTFLRSSAKPFQILPFLESGGHKTYQLMLREIAIMCASHHGTDEHVAVVHSIQNKTGVSENDLLCGVHPPFHELTSKAMQQRAEQPTPNRHNCSGKHTGMLAYARMKGQSTEDYINPLHPIQKTILHTFAEMVDLPIDKVDLGIDGCSAPIFSVPLQNAALAYARLCEPEKGSVLPEARAEACHTVTEAMTTYPDMVGGPTSFDTRLMQVTRGRIVAKGGAEGYQGIGLLPGAIAPGSPALGITIKISDGDLKTRARAAVSLETLRQLDALSADEMEAIAEFGPNLAVYNWRKLIVGQARPCFELKRY